jgi:hypothetical protein
MLDVNATIKNLESMEGNINDFQNDVICCFEDAEEEIIVSKQYGRQEDYQIYENDEDAPIICICVNMNEKRGTYKITNAW